MSGFVSNAFITLLAVIDPIGLAPLFVGLTRGRSEVYKREAAIRGTALATMILFLFTFVGQGTLNALGIGFPAFRIAGGALLFLLSLDMILTSPSGMRQATVREGEDVAAILGVLLAVLLLTLASLLLASRIMNLVGEIGATSLAAPWAYSSPLWPSSSSSTASDKALICSRQLSAVSFES
ncbi:MAG: MarC family protein [Rubrobacter sp.]|nr:MarC family protein [Rubrobacter sp.]